MIFSFELVRLFDYFIVTKGGILKMQLNSETGSNVEIYDENKTYGSKEYFISFAAYMDYYEKQQPSKTKIDYLIEYLNKHPHPLNYLKKIQEGTAGGEESRLFDYLGSDFVTTNSQEEFNNIWEEVKKDFQLGNQDHNDEASLELIKSRLNDTSFFHLYKYINLKISEIGIIKDNKIHDAIMANISEKIEEYKEKFKEKIFESFAVYFSSIITNNYGNGLSEQDRLNYIVIAYALNNVASASANKVRLKEDINNLEKTISEIEKEILMYEQSDQIYNENAKSLKTTLQALTTKLEICRSFFGDDSDDQVKYISLSPKFFSDINKLKTFGDNQLKLLNYLKKITILEQKINKLQALGLSGNDFSIGKELSSGESQCQKLLNNELSAMENNTKTTNFLKKIEGLITKAEDTLTNSTYKNNDMFISYYGYKKKLRLRNEDEEVRKNYIADYLTLHLQACEYLKHINQNENKIQLLDKIPSDFWVNEGEFRQIAKFDFKMLAILNPETKKMKLNLSDCFSTKNPKYRLFNLELYVIRKIKEFTKLINDGVKSTIKDRNIIMSDWNEDYFAQEICACLARSFQSRNCVEAETRIETPNIFTHDFFSNKSDFPALTRHIENDLKQINSLILDRNVSRDEKKYLKSIEETLQLRLNELMKHKVEDTWDLIRKLYFENLDDFISVLNTKVKTIRSIMEKFRFGSKLIEKIHAAEVMANNLQILIEASIFFPINYAKANKKEILILLTDIYNQILTIKDGNLEIANLKIELAKLIYKLMPSMVGHENIQPEQFEQLSQLVQAFSVLKRDIVKITEIKTTELDYDFLLIDTESCTNIDTNLIKEISEHTDQGIKQISDIFSNSILDCINNLNQIKKQVLSKLIAIFNNDKFNDSISFKIAVGTLIENLFLYSTEQNFRDIHDIRIKLNRYNFVYQINDTLEIVKKSAFEKCDEDGFIVLDITDENEFEILNSYVKDKTKFVIGLTDNEFNILKDNLKAKLSEFVLKESLNEDLKERITRLDSVGSNVQQKSNLSPDDIHFFDQLNNGLNEIERRIASIKWKPNVKAIRQRAEAYLKNGESFIAQSKDNLEYAKSALIRKLLKIFKRSDNLQFARSIGQLISNLKPAYERNIKSRLDQLTWDKFAARLENIAKGIKKIANENMNSELFNNEIQAISKIVDICKDNSKKSIFIVSGHITTLKNEVVTILRNMFNNYQENPEVANAIVALMSQLEIKGAENLKIRINEILERRSTPQITEVPVDTNESDEVEEEPQTTLNEVQPSGELNTPCVESEHPSHITEVPVDLNESDEVEKEPQTTLNEVQPPGKLDTPCVELEHPSEITGIPVDPNQSGEGEDELRTLNEVQPSGELNTTLEEESEPVRLLPKRFFPTIQGNEGERQKLISRHRLAISTQNLQSTLGDGSPPQQPPTPIDIVVNPFAQPNNSTAPQKSSVLAIIGKFILQHKVALIMGLIAVAILGLLMAAPYLLPVLPAIAPLVLPIITKIATFGASGWIGSFISAFVAGGMLGESIKIVAGFIMRNIAVLGNKIKNNQLFSSLKTRKLEVSGGSHSNAGMNPYELNVLSSGNKNNVDDVEEIAEEQQQGYDRSILNDRTTAASGSENYHSNHHRPR
jgi:hypothetical protein